MSAEDVAALRAQLEQLQQDMRREMQNYDLPRTLEASIIDWTGRLTALLAVLRQENTEDKTLTHVDSLTQSAVGATGGNNEPLRRFARKVLAGYFGDGEIGDIDGGTLEEWAEECGLLVRVEVTEFCGEECSCAEYYGYDALQRGSRVKCLRPTAALSPSVGEARSDDWDGGPLSRVPVVPRAETQDLILAAPRAEAAAPLSANAERLQPVEMVAGDRSQAIDRDPIVMAADAAKAACIRRLRRAIQATVDHRAMPLNADECVTILEHMEWSDDLPVAEASARKPLALNQSPD